MKIIILLFLIILTSCTNNTNSAQCIKPTGLYSFTFKEISGDCGAIFPQSEDIEMLGICTNNIVFDSKACTYSVYDDCVENLQEVEFTYLSKVRIEGELFVWLPQCQSRYEVVGTK